MEDDWTITFCHYREGVLPKSKPRTIYYESKVSSDVTVF